MDISVISDDAGSAKDKLLVLPLSAEDIKKPAVKAISKAVKNAIESKDFKGEFKESVILYAPDSVKSARLLLLGLGKGNEITLERIRRAMSIAAKTASSLKLDSFSAIIPEAKFSESDTASATVEGVMLGSYRFDKYKSENKEYKKLQKLSIVSKKDAKKIKETVDKTKKICENVIFVRDLVNEGSDIKPPQMIAETAMSICKKLGIRYKVFGETELKKMGMNLLLAVGSGSRFEPKLIVMEYYGNKKSREKFVLVGKGITFDSGGLNLKPTGYIEAMKSDMAGAAAVIGTIKTLSELKIKKNVIGIIPCCENIIGPKSYKPGAVIKSYSGKTVEILNTDAEGRLILADAISYAVKNFKPELVIDLATLTGACVVTFDHYVTGMLTNSQKHAKKIFECGEKTYERVWELPLYEEYEEEMKSDVADIPNINPSKTPYGGAINGAIFLKKFVEKTPWIHLDIAGTAWFEKNFYYLQKGGTGVGVRLLVRFFEEL